MTNPDRDRVVRELLLKARNGFVACYTKVGNVRAWKGTAEDIDWLTKTLDEAIEALDAGQRSTPPPSEDVEALVRRLHDEGGCSDRTFYAGGDRCEDMSCWAAKLIRAAILAGRASRDGEVEGLQREFGMRETIDHGRRARIAELEAEVERLRGEVARLRKET